MNRAIYLFTYLSKHLFIYSHIYSLFVRRQKLFIHFLFIRFELLFSKHKLLIYSQNN